MALLYADSDTNASRLAGLSMEFRHDCFDEQRYRAPDPDARLEDGRHVVPKAAVSEQPTTASMTRAAAGAHELSGPKKDKRQASDAK